MTLPVVVGIGEVLWDLFESGAALGGAPANFACHASSLGADVFLVSAVGDDERGRDAIESLSCKDIDTTHVQKSVFATGVVDISLDAGGEPEYEIAEHAAWDHVGWDDRLLDLAARADAVCFGTLFQRSPLSRETLIRFLNATSDRVLRVFDVNLRMNWFDDQIIAGSLQFANVLKVNAEELPVVARACGVDGDENAMLRELLGRFELKLIALTDGGNGSRLITQNGVCIQKPNVVEVRDTVGAGDAFTACVTIGLLCGMQIEDIGELASSVAAWVCTRGGATPVLPAALAARLGL